MINLKIKNNSFLKYYLTTNIISFYNLNAMEDVKKKDINNKIINIEKKNNKNEIKQNLNEIKKIFKFNDINIEIEKNKEIYNSIKTNNPIYNYFYYDIEYLKNTKYNKYIKNKNFQKKCEIIFSNKNKTIFNNNSNKDYFNKFDFNENQIKNNNIINKDYSEYRKKDTNYVTAIFENTPNDDIISIKRNCNYVSYIIKEYKNEKKYRIYFNENLMKLKNINVFINLKISDIDLQNFNIYNITDISNMFDNCKYLKNITFGGKFNTSNVLFFRAMFAYCTSLEILDLSNLNLNINIMNNMFDGCVNLKSLNLSNLNISNTKKENLNKIFKNCNNLENLNLSNTKGDVIMFFLKNRMCLTGLKNLDISNTSTYYTNLDNSFKDFKKLENINMTNFKINLVNNLKKLIDYNENYGNLITLENMFKNCKSLKTLDLSKTVFNKISNMNNMFENCVNLKDLNLANLNINSIDEKKIVDIFKNCKNLINLNLSNVQGDPICFFYNNKEDLLKLKKLDLSNTITYCDNLDETFKDMKNLENLNLSNVNISRVKSLNYLFYNCCSLNTLNLKNLNISKIHNITNAFTGCEKLISRNIISDGISKKDIHNLFRRDKLDEHSYYSRY